MTPRGRGRSEPAPEPPAGEHERHESPVEDPEVIEVIEVPRSGPKMTEELSKATTLVELIDRGIYGMGPSGRRAKSVVPSERSPDPPGQTRRRTQSLKPERPRDLRGPDPWAAYFGSERADVPVWGQLPFRLKRQISSVVRESEAELTTGHIPVLRDESIDLLLGGADGKDGYYADGTFGRGR